MSDIELFKVSESSVQRRSASTIALEHLPQQLTERNLEQLMGIRFLASEYATRKT